MKNIKLAKGETMENKEDVIEIINGAKCQKVIETDDGEISIWVPIEKIEYHEETYKERKQRQLKVLQDLVDEIMKYRTKRQLNEEDYDGQNPVLDVLFELIDEILDDKNAWDPPKYTFEKTPDGLVLKEIETK